MVASAKHFVGDGGTQKGINENDTIIDPNGLFGIHMPAYLDAIAKGVSTVMISYSSWNGVKMHTNRDLITGVLKNKLGFKVSPVKLSAPSLSCFRGFVGDGLILLPEMIPGISDLGLGGPRQDHEPARRKLHLLRRSWNKRRYRYGR